MRTYLQTLIVLIVVVFLVLGCASQDTAQPADSGPELSPSTESELLSLLAFVPDLPGYRSLLTYGDKVNWYKHWEVKDFGDKEQLFSQERAIQDLWKMRLPADTLFPPRLHVEYMITIPQREYFGFDIFSLDRYLYAGEGKDTITAAELGSAANGIDAALMNSGYQSEGLDGDCTLYSKYDDYEFAQDEFQWSTKMGNDLNRVALCEKYVVAARATSLAENAVLAHHGEVESLAQRDEYIAAAAVLEGEVPEKFGDLISVILVEGIGYADSVAYSELAGSLRSPLAEESAAQLEKYVSGPRLPEYSLAGFAAFHKDDISYSVLALVFSKDADLAGVPELLAERVLSYKSMMLGRRLDEIMNWETEMTEVMDVGGLPVAVVALSYPDPQDPDQAKSRRPMIWGRLVPVKDTAFLVTQ